MGSGLYNLLFPGAFAALSVSSVSSVRRPAGIGPRYDVIRARSLAAGPRGEK